MAEFLVASIASGAMAETPASMDRAAVYGELTGGVFNVSEGLDLTVVEPRTPREPSGAPSPIPEWRVAELVLGPVLNRIFGPGCQVPPRFAAPGAAEGKMLGRTVPEYHHPRLRLAFEVKRLDLTQMGLLPDGSIIRPASKATGDALTQA